MSQQAIICVDDEIIVLNALKEQLQLGFGDDLLIEIAESGEEALEIIDELIEDGLDVAAVIADFIMPGMKGDDLLEQIHKKNPDTKKIMLTGQASLEGIENAVNNAELYRYVSKPWDKEDLNLTIREAIKGYNQGVTIQNQNKELKELNTNLELKVEERTLELQELNATKDKFFSIIAHDLKNPFNTLLGFSELMIENFELYDPKQLKDYINIIFETSRTSYNLLENLLHWSRSQTGKLKLSPSVFDFHKVITENFDFLENLAVKKSIVLNNGINENETVNADYNMIETVVRNLISNAIKFTNDDGTIKVNAVRRNKMLEVCVEDSGIGIRQEKIRVLFAIDMSSSTKGTANETGTGLGLILCKEFVELNGGKIWVESEPDVGSKFFFTIPLSE